MPGNKQSYAPLVSIIIVNWNGLDDTKLCLKHTRNQTYRNIELIVVDNGSQDGSVQYLRKQEDIKLVENPKNLGFTGGHIAGYKASTGEYILLLNNDAIMDKNYVELAVNAMAANKEIGALGGRAYLWDENNDLFDTTNSFYAYQNVNPITGEGIFTRHDLGVQQSVNVVSGSCVMIRRKITEEVGYLHDPFFAYFEESDLFARMKRAGYKVIYDPQLAIWHANAKTTNKKAPTFFYYMIMRNRFRFAVRNFDRWSLHRFLFFYFKMGVVSIIKSLLPLKQRPMHWAYAKAFFYNLVAGWKVLYERRQLRRQHGPSSYNQMIVREQTGISIVSSCDTKKSLDIFIEVAKDFEPIDELLLVVKDNSLINYLESQPELHPTVRICIDRGYFDTPLENIGSICAKNEWLILTNTKAISELSPSLNKFSKSLYFITRSQKKLAFIASVGSEFQKLEDFLNNRVSPELFVKRELLIDEGGLDKSISTDNAKREIIAYSFWAKNYFPILSKDNKADLPKYSGLSYQELHEKLKAKLRQSKYDHKKPNTLDRVAHRYYRIAQVINLVTWLFYPRIPLRLKLGRSKNIIFAILRLNRSSLATELKHMRNEVLIYRNSLDVVSMKMTELMRLEYLRANPSETLIFIILRDRYEPLRELLKWLEAQNLKKIIFIDNDSKLPPLTDFLRKTNYQVLEMGRNMTQTAPWSGGVIKILVPDDFYIVTDPDIIPTQSRNEVISHLYDVHSEYPHHLKVGLGLKIDDLPDHYPLKSSVIKWESQFWKYELQEEVYEAGVDTTFALYKPRTYKYLLNPSLRTGEPYTARHLPWYSKPDDQSDEEIFYRLRADHSVSSWSKDQLPERYKRELEKQV